MTTTGTKRFESTCLRQAFTALAALLLTTALPASAGHHEEKAANPDHATHGAPNAKAAKSGKGPKSAMATPGADDAKGAVCSDRGHCADCKHCQHHECSDESCPLDHAQGGHGGMDAHHGAHHGGQHGGEHGGEHGMSHADGHGPGGAMSGHPEPNPEARAKMAAAHERLAACLRSTRPIGECHAEMKRHHGAAMGGKRDATGKPAKATN